MIKTLSKFESEMSYKVFFLNKGSDITFDLIYESFEIQILIKTLSKKKYLLKVEHAIYAASVLIQIY